MISNTSLYFPNYLAKFVVKLNFPNLILTPYYIIKKSQPKLLPDTQHTRFFRFTKFVN